MRLTLEGQVKYVDYLQLRSFATRLGVTAISDQSPPTPNFDYLSDISSPDDLLGLEHFYDFNDKVGLTSNARVGIIFRQIIGCEPVPRIDYGLTHEQKRYIGPGYRIYKNLREPELVEATQVMEHVVITNRLGGVQRRNPDTLPLPPYFMKALPKRGALSTAQLRAAAHFVIPARNIHEKYLVKMGVAVEEEDKVSSEAHFLGALAMYLDLQFRLITDGTQQPSN